MDTNEFYFRIFLIFLLILSPWILYIVLDLIFPNNKKIEKVFSFFLYCFRWFIYSCFWIILIFFAPFILFFGFIFSQELFDYLNEIVIKIDEMAQKVLEENKKKFK